MEIKKSEAMEMSAQELDNVAGGNGLDQALVKDLDAAFAEQNTADARIAGVGGDGAQVAEFTKQNQVKTVLDNDLIAKQGDF